MDGNNTMHDATNIETRGMDQVSKVIILVGAIPCPITNPTRDKGIF
jgi:hypothetical protein